MWLFLTGLLLAAVCGYLDCFIDWYQKKTRKPRPTSQTRGHGNLCEVSPVGTDHSDFDKNAPDAIGHNDLNKMTHIVTGHSDLHEISPAVKGQNDFNKPSPEVTNHRNFDEISREAGHDGFGGHSSSQTQPTTNGGLRCSYVSDLHKKRGDCRKNSGHETFIPVNTFNIKHLPEGYRKPQDLDFIYAVISLTVRVVLSYVSCDRPDIYPFYQDRGRPIQAYGSGRVCKVYRKYSVTDGETCPCPQCEKLFYKYRKKQWGKFMVRTAKHVIYDIEESRHTQIDVDYNTDTDRDTCPKLHGVGVERGNRMADSSYIICVSHDRDVCHKLEERCQRFDDLFQERTKVGSLSENSPPSCEKKPFTVCISHPHGMSKHVTIGTFRALSKELPHTWIYTTDACPGTSGAPVIRLGNMEGNVFPGLISYHSGYSTLGYNVGRNELTSPY